MSTAKPIDKRSPATLIVASSTSKYRARADYICDGTADDVQINAALDALPAAGGKVVLMEGTFNLTATLTPPTDAELCGQGEATILNVAGISTATSNCITMNNRCAVRHLKIIGDIDPLEVDGRALAIANNCEVEDVWMTTNNYGLNIGSTAHIRIRNVRFDNIKSSAGWAACIHVTGSGAEDVVIDGVYIDTCNRAIEIEDGAANVYASNGYIKSVTSASQASFVLNAHTHNGTGTVENVTFSNFYIEDCNEPLFCFGDNATDHIRSISYQNITLKDCGVYSSNPLLGVAFGSHVEFKNIRSTGCSDTKVLAVGNGCDNILFDHLHIENDAQITPSLAGQGIVIRDSYFTESTDATNTLSIDGGNTGDNILFDHITVDDVNGSYGLRIGGVTNVMFINPRIISGGSMVIGVYFLAGSTAIALDGGSIEGAISVQSRQTGGRIANVRITETIQMDAASSNTIVENNTILAGSITDAGTGNVIRNNIGWVTESDGAAANVSDGGTIAHGCAAAPTVAVVSPSVASEMASVTGIDATNITVAIKTDAGAAGTQQTIYWRAWV